MGSKLNIPLILGGIAIFALLIVQNGSLIYNLIGRNIFSESFVLILEITAALMISFGIMNYITIRLVIKKIWIIVIASLLFAIFLYFHAIFFKIYIITYFYAELHLNM